MIRGKLRVLTFTTIFSLAQAGESEIAFVHALSDLLAAVLRGKPKVWTEAVEKLLAAPFLAGQLEGLPGGRRGSGFSEVPSPTNCPCLEWVCCLISALKVDWQDDYLHDQALRTMRSLKLHRAELSSTQPSPETLGTRAALAEVVAELMCSLHSNISRTVDRRTAMLRDRDTVLGQLVTEGGERVRALDLLVDGAGESLVRLRAQTSDLKADISQRLLDLGPQREENKAKTDLLTKEAEALTARLRAISDDLEALRLKAAQLDQVEQEVKQQEFDTGRPRPLYYTLTLPPPLVGLLLDKQVESALKLEVSAASEKALVGVVQAVAGEARADMTELWTQQVEGVRGFGLCTCSSGQ